METIYLDYNATTPVDPVVIEKIRTYLDPYFGNPSSSHVFGLQTKKAVENARSQVAALLNARNDEIVFTSGGTESNNFAIKGVAFANRSKGNHIITTCIEHPAVTEVCHYLEKEGFRVTWLPVDGFGMVNAADVEKAITPETILISVMHANNETGTIQPIEEIGIIARRMGVLFHSDAAQSVGKIGIDVEKLHVDLLSVAGHKLYAPKGVGALYIRRGVKLAKLIHGADHESNLRAGTENVAGIAGLGAASELVTISDAGYQVNGQNNGNLLRKSGMLHGTTEIRALLDMLHDGIRSAIPQVRLNGHPEKRLPNTLSLGFPGVEASVLLDEMKGIAASAGAACHSDQADISGVLSAMHVPMEYAIGTIRFSLGRMTTREEIEAAIPLIVDAFRRLKGESKPAIAGIRLTEFTHSLGCACKIRPQLLENILKTLPRKNNPAILVGHETADDAAVYLINETTAIVQTVDFIPPVVDDPYMYGAIAAANALSDIYAMGGTPLFALSIVGFPDRKLPMEVLHQILKGANDKVSEAGIQVVGGHSVEDGEPKFGLVVTGLVHPGKIWHNSTSKSGDVLVLTKPIGTGILTTAIKRGLANETATGLVMKVMAELNRTAAEVAAGFEINACTDVTGFGLLGHMKEMVCGAGLRAKLNARDIPLLDEVWNYAAAGIIPGGTKNNLAYVEEIVNWHPDTPELLKFILADAQTSGGLLISLPASQAGLLVSGLHNAGVTRAAVIGILEAGPPGISV
jgi:cysteine desulfurase NifS/selenium donor protein